MPALTTFSSKAFAATASIITGTSEWASVPSSAHATPTPTAPLYQYVASPLETAPPSGPSHADWVSTHTFLICMAFFLLFGVGCGFYKLLEICKEARKMRPKDPEMGQVFHAQPFQAPQIAAPPKVATSSRGRPVVHMYVSMDEVLRGHRCVLV
ncbi:hypothetical protein FB45DRAFT_869155 [Roridomyces roridus]|uniref:Uncharacterized protein n=1 Tax=Roridomyces roridus TaxID=1738132 RepID=A0AAD7BNH3_9AGAR|nr:hypothetical protein FB45DRAFT_869155 [Roridomyces roridus]